jgi:hypothetical protein
MPGIKNPVIRERNSQRFFGCSEAEAIRLNNGLPLRDRSGLALRYYTQRYKAGRRGIGWEITFPEWVAVWESSGLLECRGVGREGFCMARHGDEGPYRADNVSIKSCSQNSREGLLKTHRLGRAKLPVSAQVGSGRGWTKRAKGPRPYQVQVGEKYVGTYATEAEARTAYLAAVEAHQDSFR